MKIKSLEKTKINNGLYDLYTTIINNDKTYNIYSFPCTDRHNMRMDLVCLDIYENVNEIDVLCWINGIMNPLTIQSGDIILFIDPEDVIEVRSTDNLMNDILSQIKNANKGKEFKIDKNRNNDLKQRKVKEKEKKLLPPHILDSNRKNLNMENGNIKRGPNF